MPAHKRKTPSCRADSLGANAQTSSETIDDLSPAGKALAVILYNRGARTLEQTQQLFRRHAAWRAA